MSRPRVWLVRHGETEWSARLRHTGRTDVPLTDAGRAAAAALGPRLAAVEFGLVLCSPLSRARETCSLAGLGAAAVHDDDLMEWDYGEYEGLTTAQIRRDRPGWTIFTEQPTRGETLEEVAVRADRVVARLLAAGSSGVDDAAVVAHGHLLRVLAARWIGQDPRLAAYLHLSTAALSQLGWERETPCIEFWNDASHVPGSA